MAKRKSPHKRKVAKELQVTAKYIIVRLKKKGIVVQRYDSYSTNSIYLKLDYGVSNSIRISDHKGKKHLSYRYNVLTSCPYPVSSKDYKGFVRFYVPISEWDMLIRKILFDRSGQNEYVWTEQLPPIYGKKSA
ncbi:hypothetical protein ACA29_03085 [Lederbergia galactosidilytica]|uniref:Uncharacterized protein n=1 Tax=Lederbergia galactosidilytica TaxID=217031 RepID=A0A0Q9Y7N0_9BACI|nr:hypothetical protein ACA29_03085 [Lederbergia galactosidilytica]